MTLSASTIGTGDQQALDKCLLNELRSGLRSPPSSVPGNHLLHPHSHLSLVISSPFWGHLQPHLHLLLLVPLLPISEMDNLQN